MNQFPAARAEIAMKVCGQPVPLRHQATGFEATPHQPFLLFYCRTSVTQNGASDFVTSESRLCHFL